jgi:transcriptional regulator of heat shock response
MNQTNGQHDPVENGIREWQKCKAAAEEAIEIARKAQEEAAFLRGQNELLTKQHESDVERMRMLQQHVDEMDIMVSTLGSSVLAVIEKRKAGFFRRAGSIKDGNERTRAVREHADHEELDSNLRELIRRSSTPVEASPNQ